MADILDNSNISNVQKMYNDILNKQLLINGDYEEYNRLLAEILQIYKSAITRKSDNDKEKISIKHLTTEDGKKLEEKYRSILKTSENIINNLSDDDTKNMFLSMQDLLNKDYNQVINTDFNKDITIKEFFSASRAIHIDITGEKARNVGAESSSRKAVSYYDANGNLHKGFFTEDRVLSRKQDFEKLFDDTIKNAENNYLVKKENEYKYFSDFIKVLKKGIINNIENVDTEKNAAFRLKNASTVASSFKTFLDKSNHKYTNEEINGNKIFNNLIKDFSKKADLLSNNNFQYTIGVKAEDGSSIPKRNVAMSIMANLLGMPDILARSVNATFKDSNGEKNGVFMENAVGVDLGSYAGATKVKKLLRSASIEKCMNNVSMKKSLC